MKAVVAAFDAVADIINEPKWRDRPAVDQEGNRELRYTRNSDFTDVIAADFLSREIDSIRLREMLTTSAKPELLDPVRF